MTFVTDVHTCTANTMQSQREAVETMSILQTRVLCLRGYVPKEIDTGFDQDDAAVSSGLVKYYGLRLIQDFILLDCQATITTNLNLGVNNGAVREVCQH